MTKGSESTLYTVSGEMKIDEYKEILSMCRSGQPCIHDPFEERDVKVVFASMEYDGSNEMFTFEFIEDIVWGIGLRKLDEKKEILYVIRTLDVLMSSGVGLEAARYTQ